MPYIFPVVVANIPEPSFVFLALYAYKKFSPSGSRVSQSQFLEIEESVSLGVRKQLHVVRAGDEKFLIASDAERTTFLSKLNVGQKSVVEEKRYSQVDYDLDNFYERPEERFVAGRGSTEILRNIISSGERR